MNTLTFTHIALLDLLSQIDELSDKQIGIAETPDGGIQIQIDNSIYNVKPEQPVDVDISEYEETEVANAIEDTYNELIENEDISIDEFNQPIESGIIGELAKTLFVGGMVRLGVDALKK